MNIVEEESGEYQYIKKGFLKGMGFMMHATNIIAIHKNNVSSNLTKQARLDSFHIFSKAVSIKCGGDANVRFAWYGGSLDELMNIVSFGFTGCNIHVDEDNGGESHGVGISLSSANFSIDSAMSSVADENGLRHVLLCRVILGRVENVPADSKQSQPSCKHYDTGVDDISSPKKHIIWTAFMNSYIHPDYILSFKYNYITGPEIFGTVKPRSEYVLFPNLVAKVSNHLKPSQMSLLLKSYRIYQEQNITRELWISKVRKIVGDRLLHSVITGGDMHPI
ncbi:putative inactive poly [ADP-ribose] polymerase SRO2 [Trifolium repens]|nr:putative inactive poly [ADP-ribose] polymerase SRO2 [Trifolium repens]